MYVVHRRDEFRADRILQDSLRSCENVEIIWDSVAVEIQGAEQVTGVKLSNVKTGQPFIKYLTDFRMNKAKELLRCTGKKSSEIGLEVGYKDPHYFSALFRKTQGMTPTQYREGKA